MLEGLGTLVGILVAVISVMVLLGAAFVTFKGSFNKARIQGLRDDNQDLRERVIDSELEITQLKNQLEIQGSKLDSLDKENATLKDMITQRAQVDELKQLLSDHHSESLQAWSAISLELGRIGRRNP